MKAEPRFKEMGRKSMGGALPRFWVESGFRAAREPPGIETPRFFIWIRHVPNHPMIGLLQYCFPAVAFCALWTMFSDRSAIAQSTSPIKERDAKSAAVLKSEFIFEEASFPECHASTIAETADGLVAAWFGGTRERHPDVGIWTSHQVVGHWTKPIEVT